MGRYDAVAMVEKPLEPDGEFLPEGKREHGNIEIAHARVEAPGETRAYHLSHGKYHRGMVNVANDPLEREFKYGRISNDAYLAGRAYQAVMEASFAGSSGINLEAARSVGDHESLVAKRYDRVAAAVDLDRRIKARIGAWAALLLRGVLVDGHRIRTIAKRNGRCSKNAVARVMQEFREALEDLADELDNVGLTNGSS